MSEGNVDLRVGSLEVHLKAIVKEDHAAGHLVLRDWPEPVPERDEVKIAVAGAGICGTDLHIIDGNWPCRPPVVLGHEFCGTVTEVGASVTGFLAGDRVVASNPARTCGSCYHCREGNPFMCAQRVSVGYMIDGAFADYICITEQRCHKLPGNVSFRQAALGEPLSAAVHALIERVTLHAGDVAVISGPGCVGLFAMLIAKLHGMRTIVVGLTKDSRRLALAHELGADVVVNINEVSLVDMLREQGITDGADLVCECAGAPASLATCLEVVRKEGTLLQIGMYTRPFEVDFNKVAMKELSVIGSFGYVWTSWQRSLRLLQQGLLSIDGLVSHELSLADFEKGLRMTRDGTATKVILNPQLGK